MAVEWDLAWRDTWKGERRLKKSLLKSPLKTPLDPIKASIRTHLYRRERLFTRHNSTIHRGTVAKGDTGGGVVEDEARECV